MPLAPRLSNLAVNAATDAVTALCDGGSIAIYDGGQPSTADTAVSSQVLLVTLAFGTPAFAPAVNGVAVANGITSGTAAAMGVASWFRARQSDGLTTVFDGSVDTVAADLNLSDTAIPFGAPVSVSSFTYTSQKA